MAGKLRMYMIGNVLIGDARLEEGRNAVDDCFGDLHRLADARDLGGGLAPTQRVEDMFGRDQFIGQALQIADQRQVHAM